MAKDSSAVEIVLPPGVFMTTTPRCVAASTSTLSTPTPARPTTRNLRRGLDDLAGHLGFGAHDHRRPTSATSGSSSASDSRLGSTIT